MHMQSSHELHLEILGFKFNDALDFSVAKKLVDFGISACIFHRLGKILVGAEEMNLLEKRGEGAVQSALKDVAVHSGAVVI
eukprot:CAMPEP_0202102118 /NCGR_PEP_ID=MMETSP0965-20130614/4117_1 /ASSEMBLY_ACC=CAM_ASM_000507 /TAXON_ID=4773 /ORGANISM="Schizochytrium aggregatum, Strain ATCC28209" /LENGTH=80 /DNA_ID=CAMNT_0048670863 /DNA_START=104 /DNA_END=346 /DNA_ORIENTATION=-